MTSRTLSTRRPLIALAAAAALATTAVAPAIAGGTAPVVKAGKAGRAKVVTSSRGRTLYALAPETAKKLLCKSSTCLQAWPPLLTGKSTKLVAGSGVKGKLGRFSRGGGKYQVTLRGLPLYTYVGDSGSGTAAGDGLRSFGGTWHVVKPAG